MWFHKQASRWREVVMRPGDRSLCSIALSPADDYLAVGTNKDSISLWELKNGTEVAFLEPHTFAGYAGSEITFVHSLSFSPDNSSLVARIGKQCWRKNEPQIDILLFDLASGRVRQRIPFDEGRPYHFHSCHFSKDGRSLNIVLATTWKGDTDIRRAPDSGQLMPGRAVARWSIENAAWDSKPERIGDETLVSVDDKLLPVASYIDVWALTLKNIHMPDLTCSLWPTTSIIQSDDGKQAALIGEGPNLGMALLFDPENGHVIRQITVRERMHDGRFAPKLNLVAIAADKKGHDVIQLWRLTDDPPKLIETLDREAGRPFCFSSDGTLIAARTSYRAGQGYLVDRFTVWKLNS